MRCLITVKRALYILKTLVLIDALLKGTLICDTDRSSRLLVCDVDQWKMMAEGGQLQNEYQRELSSFAERCQG